MSSMAWAVGVLGGAVGGTAAIDQLILSRGPQPGSEAGFTGAVKSPADGSNPEYGQGYVWNPFDRRLPAGSPAPDFDLPAVGGGRVTLARFRGRPLVLVFGSFTCDKVCDRAVELERLYRAHRDRAAFLLVNVTEANHPIPGLEFVTGGPPADRAERIAEAGRVTGLSLPAAVDEGQAAERAYNAFPARLVVVAADGTVGLDLGRPMSAPWDLGEVEAWLGRR
ncbi:MAG: redoxin domain-containing protein [Gemmataceae bacterium]|nr:redoxin domain-containing protein [Gemmataceae bacterium]